MVGGASWDWIFVVNVFSVFRGLRGPKVLRSSCTKGSFSLGPPNASVRTKGFRRQLRSSLVLGKKTHYRPTFAQPQKNTHPLLQQLFPNFSFCPLTKKPTITPDRTHRHHVCA